MEIGISIIIAIALTVANIALELRERKKKNAEYIKQADIFRGNLK